MLFFYLFVKNDTVMLKVFQFICFFVRLLFVSFLLELLYISNSNNKFYCKIQKHFILTFEEENKQNRKSKLERRAATTERKKRI